MFLEKKPNCCVFHEDIIHPQIGKTIVCFRSTERKWSEEKRALKKLEIVKILANSWSPCYLAFNLASIYIS